MSEPIRTRQTPLFIESLEEAIEALAMACGGKKSFACELRPDLADEPDKAHRWLLDALNSDRRTELHAAHLVRALKIGRRHNCHVLKKWLDDEARYEHGAPKHERSKYEVVAEEFQKLAAQLADKASTLAALEREENIKLEAVR